MRRAAIFLGLLAAALLSAWWPKPPPPAADPIDSLLAAHCLECHGSSSKDGDLTGLREAGFDTLHKTPAKLHTREMPPKDRPQPEPAGRDRLTAWIEARLSTLRYDGPPDPGHVTIRHGRHPGSMHLRRFAIDLSLHLPAAFVGPVLLGRGSSALSSPPSARSARVPIGFTRELSPLSGFDKGAEAPPHFFLLFEHGLARMSSRDA